MKYKAEPKIINAMQWNGENEEELHVFTDYAFNTGPDPEDPTVQWAEVYNYLQQSWLPVPLNGYVVEGDSGEFYARSQAWFEAKYVEVEDTLGGPMEGTWTT